MFSNHSPITLQIDKQYVKTVCEGQVRRVERKVSYGEQQEALLGIVVDVVRYLTGLLPADEIAGMQKCLSDVNSPESLVSGYITSSFELKIKAIIRRKSDDLSLTESQLREKFNEEIKQFSATMFFTMLSPKTKQQMAIMQTSRMRKSLEAKAGDVLRIVDTIAVKDNVSMNLERNVDPLYSQDMVQHLIRLRLDDPEIQPSYMQLEEEQTAIKLGNRIWLGLYELSELTISDLLQHRYELRQRLVARLNALTEDERKCEICISVRSFQRDGSGHYNLLTLQPDPNSPGEFVMHSLNTLISPDDKSSVHGVEGELRAAAAEVGIKVSEAIHKQVIKQPTNQSCGPTHVEVVSAVMTQKCLLGAVSENYMSHPTIYPTADHLLHVSNTHYCDLVKNEITFKSMLARGEEESIFKLVALNDNKRELGFVPPSIEHLQQANIISDVAEEKVKAIVHDIKPIEKSKWSSGFESFIGLAIMVAPVVMLACFTPLSVGVLVGIGVACFVVGALIMVHGLNGLLGNKHSPDDAANHPTRAELSTHARVIGKTSKKRKRLGEEGNVNEKMVIISGGNDAAAGVIDNDNDHDHGNDHGNDNVSNSKIIKSETFRRS